ncbi:MAG: hypothetical protein SOZ58_11965 [Prevotella sp.]|nr:hypothetical protein [Prevotella sp.]
MKKILMMMVMMLTIVVSTSGKTNTHRVNDRKSPVRVEVKVCPPRPVVDRGYCCKCNCHSKSWRVSNGKPCKKCQKHIKKMQKLHEKQMKEMHRHYNSHK